MMNKILMSSQIVPWRVPFVLITGVIVFIGCVVGFLFIADIETASGENRLGILGQPAPELALADWIDGDGQKMSQVRISALKGKVVYLYFFQDW